MFYSLISYSEHLISGSIITSKIIFQKIILQCEWSKYRITLSNNNRYWLKNVRRFLEHNDGSVFTFFRNRNRNLHIEICSMHFSKYLLAPCGGERNPGLSAFRKTLIHFQIFISGVLDAKEKVENPWFIWWRNKFKFHSCLIFYL